MAWVTSTTFSRLKQILIFELRSVIRLKVDPGAVVGDGSSRRAGVEVGADDRKCVAAGRSAMISC
jgi:hypothetical protein